LLHSLQRMFLCHPGRSIAVFGGLDCQLLVEEGLRPRQRFDTLPDSRWRSPRHGTSGRGFLHPVGFAPARRRWNRCRAGSVQPQLYIADPTLLTLPIVPSVVCWWRHRTSASGWSDDPRVFFTIQLSHEWCCFIFAFDTPTSDMTQLICVIVREHVVCRVVVVPRSSSTALASNLFDGFSSSNFHRLLELFWQYNDRYGSVSRGVHVILSLL